MTFARTWIPIVALAAVTASPSVARGEEGTLTLSEAYALAVRYNDQFQIAAENAEAAEIRLRDTWSDIRPTITATAQTAVQRELENSGIVFVPRIQWFQGSITARQPLFRKGFFASRDAERFAYKSANATLSRERERLARDVAFVFIDVLRTRSIVVLSQGAVKRTTTQYEYIVARVKAGNTLKTAELLADIDVKRAQRQLITAQRDVGVAEANFTQLVGRAPPAVLEMPPQAAPPALTNGLEVAKKRDDLFALELRVREAEARTEAAEGLRFWPTLDLTGGATFFVPEVQDLTYRWQVLGVLTIPLLQSGAEANEIALRENATRIAKLQVEQQRKLTTAEVQAAWVVVETATAAQDVGEKQLKAATDHYALVDKQFRLGAITFLEVTNATNALAEAELALEIARMERVRAIYDYMFVTGAIDLAAGKKP
jgi:outer membrane protein